MLNILVHKLEIEAQIVNTEISFKILTGEKIKFLRRPSSYLGTQPEGYENPKAI